MTKKPRNPHYQTVVTSVKLGDLDTVKEMLQLGLAQVDWLYRGASLLCLSVCRGDLEMAELLTRAGADVNKFYTYQGYSETALIAAIRLGYEKIARTLALQSEADVNALDSSGKSGETRGRPPSSATDCCCQLYSSRWRPGGRPW